MRRFVILSAMIFILFSLCAQAALYEKIENGSMKILIKENTVTILMKDQDGNYKTSTFNKNDFDRQKLLANLDSPSDFYIQNELTIDGDKITIDGKTYSSSEIEKVCVEGEFDQGLSFKAHWPVHDYKFGKSKAIDIESESSDSRIGFGDLIVDAGETVYGDVISIGGNVKVYGEVMGDIVAVFGDVEMHDGAFAQGDVVAPFGEVVRTGSTRIVGDTVPRAERGGNQCNVNLSMDLSARFNRVEGFTPYSGIKYTDSMKELPDFHFDFGYAFALKKWDLNAGFRQDLGIDRWASYFGADIYQGAVTPDEWIITTPENTFAGLFLKEDLQDFYYHKGLKAFVGQRLFGDAHIQADYIAEKDNSLTRHTNKAIFGGDKNFRANYSTVIDEYPGALASIDGNRRLLALSFGWDNRDNPDWPRAGQFTELKWESAGDGVIADLGGDHNFDRVQATFANYLPVNPKQHMSIVLKGGYSDNNLPLDKWFFLGGLSSLRGYDYKEFAGNRYFLVNIDHYFEFSKDFALAVFGDAGKAAFGETRFNDMDLKTDLGIGIIFQDLIRIDMAQRLDNTDKSPVLTVRGFMRF